LADAVLLSSKVVINAIARKISPKRFFTEKHLQDIVLKQLAAFFIQAAFYRL